MPIDFWKQRGSFSSKDSILELNRHYLSQTDKLEKQSEKKNKGINYFSVATSLDFCLFGR